MTAVVEVQREQLRVHKAERPSDAFVQLICVERHPGEVAAEMVEGDLIVVVPLATKNLKRRPGDLDLRGFGHPTGSQRAMTRLHLKLSDFLHDRKSFRFFCDGPTGGQYAGEISFG